MTGPKPLKTANSSGPSSVPDPVPSKAEDPEVAAFIASQSSKAMPALETAQPETPAQPQQAPAGEDPEVAAYLARQAQAPQQERPWYDMSVEGTTRGMLNAIPTVGGLVGGTFGSVPGAAAGGAAGASLKASLEKAIFGEGPQSRGELYGDIASSAAENAGGQLLGEVIPGLVSLTKGATKKAIQVLGNKLAGVPDEAVGNYLEAPEAVKNLARLSNGDPAVAAEKIRSEKWLPAIDEARGLLEDPALQVMSKKTTTQSPREVGDNIKNLIKTNVTQKYGPFQKAYGELSQISRATPLPDAARVGFDQKLKSWALEEFPQSSSSYNLVKKHSESFLASNNGAQFESALGDLTDEINLAFKTGETKKAQVLKSIKDQASGFLEKQVDDLAVRIQSGKASQQEKLFLDQIAKVRGLQQEDTAKYAKSLAKDYLSSRTKIKSDYSGFKEFMDSLGEQTGLKNKGTFDFLSKIDDIPSEKLVDKMFNVKNSAALEKMKKETPEVFDQLSRFKVKELMQESMNKSNKLDVSKFYSNVQELPPEVRKLIFSADEMKSLHSVANNPRLNKLNDTVDRLGKVLDPKENYNALIASGRNAGKVKRDLSELSLLTNSNMIRDINTLGAMEYFGKQATSRARILSTSIDLAKGIQKVASPGMAIPEMQSMAGQAPLMQRVQKSIAGQGVVHGPGAINSMLNTEE